MVRSAQILSANDTGLQRQFFRVEKIAGERNGVAKAPRSGSQRTAMPTARGFSALSKAMKHRGCKTARMPALGVANAKQYPNRKVLVGVETGVIPFDRKDL